jgi:DNA-binding response OmpR family regulator
MSIEGSRVILVEDDALVGMMARDMLESMGCVVIGPLATVEQGCAAIDAGAGDLVMLDVKLGLESGWPVADRAKKASLPFFLTTGYSQESFIDDHADAPFLGKPYRMDELETIIGVCVSSAGATAGTNRKTSQTAL